MRGMAVSAEDREKAMAWLKEFEPVRLERLSQIKKEHPQDFERSLNQVAAEIRDLLVLKQNDAKRYEQRVEQRKLDYRATEIAEKVRGAGENQDTEAQREELKGILEKLFDLREADREQELKRLEEELARVKDSMKKRRDAKAKIVERRIAELLGEEDDLKWEPGGEHGNPGPAPRDR
jgi:hypothetical protein